MKNFTPNSFFRNKDDSDMKLDICQPFQVQRKTEEIAQEIANTKLLGELSAGNMIAIQAKYHCKYAAECYNEERNEQPIPGMLQKM